MSLPIPPRATLASVGLAMADEVDAPPTHDRFGIDVRAYERGGLTWRVDNLVITAYMGLGDGRRFIVRWIRADTLVVDGPATEYRRGTLFRIFRCEGTQETAEVSQQSASGELLATIDRLILSASPPHGMRFDGTLATLVRA